MANRFKVGLISAVVILGLVGIALLFSRDIMARSKSVISRGGSVDVLSGTIGKYNGKDLKGDDLQAGEKRKVYEAQMQIFQTVEDVVTQRYLVDFFENYRKKNNHSDTNAAQNAYFKENTKVSDAEVKTILERNKSNPELAAMPEKERENKVREFLGGQSKGRVIRALVEEAKSNGDIIVNVPKPTEPRLEVGDGGNYFMGPKDAPVTVVEFADYQCPYCARGVPARNEVLKKYNGKVRWVYRDFPLPFHKEAIPAAVAANCAGEQDKYFEMNTLLYKNQQKLAPLGSPFYLGLGKELNLDEAKFQTCMKDEKHEKEILADRAEGEAVGVDGTPAYYVNGRKLAGAADPAAFAALIEEELAKR